MSNRMPFAVSKSESFYEKLSEWIGDVFYDILPEAGFEIRDEQIFMAFQLEKAFKDKSVIFAEAGVGTGKTIVYLLYAISYARYINKPAIIACADETLIEQLVKKEGDIAKLEKALGLNIDVRLAKSRDQYLCLNKLDKLVANDVHDHYNRIFDDLPDFVQTGSSMQKFEKYGDRKDYPDLPDEHWKNVSWDSIQDCFTCEKRHRCGQTLHREYYRSAKDLIICSHDFYMEHIWTKESRKREGQLPLLPESSCVVFDEGHLLEYASQKALTYRFTEQILESILTRLMANDVREKTLNIIEDAIYQNEHFFLTLAMSASGDAGSDKKTIEKTADVMREGRKLQNLINTLEEELVFESEMYVINEYDLKIVEEYLEQIAYSLSLFLKDLKGITWFEETNGERTLVIMPRMVEDIMREEVFSQKKPFVFSSATLSENKSFDYMAKSLGVDEYLSFTVDSPFDYEENMVIRMPEFAEESATAKMDYILEQIMMTEGRALVLFNSASELAEFKAFASGKLSVPIFFEGDAEISTLVSNFQNDEYSVLCSVHLWEGLDIPGRSLENVLIFGLPFPPHDPVFTAKREGSSDPFREVDLPYMILRLRQGIGRLIRTHEDKGTVHILMNENENEEVRETIKKVLPAEPSIKS
ncbi:ATP-dependent DNA helicase [Cytobacillus oceanisediminis]|uniref:ATP-dependent DNA helicase n=1 Tax=Cytobacillus TaxID=2675230 RepID=UPI00203EC6DC|nr:MULTISPECIES: ATP-dependent DNA helicase [Cytobacillus]MBY0154764.1 ATP-dependent DNA helicase [Cytobacillus firmus]MCM3395037.1 ATP-dependent DNA helicase [Cytobacillus oceanisediminis]MCM3532006.1 ATP-dependent DNA helicase [Cytobacillus oceanisediminis]UQX54622.1 ATP-dependent DNA helicase [Cytobacillus pseudoceanisediminis]